MNILFFLTPKSEVAYVEETDTLRQALEKMEHHGYAAVPLLSTEGKYLGTLTDGDVLWGLKELNFPSLYQMEEIPVMQVNRSRDNKPVHVNVDMEGLLEKVSAQNFVPVIDDEKVFIGIITRRDVIHYLAVPQSGISVTKTALSFTRLRALFLCSKIPCPQPVSLIYLNAIRLKNGEYGVGVANGFHFLKCGG